MTAMRLLLVEDDTMIGESLEEGLRSERYAVDWVRDGHSALLALDHDVYDVILLDIGLPRLSGLELLAKYRAANGKAPVLIITARDSKTDRVAGLDCGADDYVVKPFDFDELCARIRALLRRNAGRASLELRHGNLVLDPAKHQVRVDGNPLELTARQFAILYALMDPPGRVLTRDQLSEKLYGWGDEVESNTVDVFIFQLRKKLGGDAIKNVRGVGYKLSEAT